MGFLTITMTTDMMKTTLKTAILACMIAMPTIGNAQTKTTMATLYKEFKPATIELTDGRTIRKSFTNVFLKNSSLLFLQNLYTMEADMETIKKVTYDDRTFTVVNKQLATLVDSVGENIIYRVDYLDLEAFNAQLKNNIQITDLSIGDQIGTTTIDLSNEEDYKFPVIHKYYMVYNHELITVHEREIWRKLPKSKRRMFKTAITMPGFSWTKDESIVALLKAITLEESTDPKAED